MSTPESTPPAVPTSPTVSTAPTVSTHSPHSSPDTLSRRNWNTIYGHRFELAQQITRSAGDFPQGLRRKSILLAQWLRGPATYEDALARPLVLALCLPLVNRLSQLPNLEAELSPVIAAGEFVDAAEQTEPVGQGTSPPNLFSAADLQSAVRWGMPQIMGRQMRSGENIWSWMVYPVILGLTAWTIWVVACFVILPSIEEIFADFGINLPQITLFLFHSSVLVRQWWVLMILIPFMYLVLFFGANALGERWSRGETSWLDKTLIGKRQTLANWVWHVSLLMEWGLAQKSAVMVAGVCSGKGWLQKLSLDWIGEAVDDRPVQPQDSQHGPRKFFPGIRFQMLNQVMNLPEGSTKIELLREVSNYYVEKGGVWRVFWARLISNVLVWLFLSFIVLILLGIYSPVLSLISGLSGGGPGGKGGGFF